MIEVARSSVQTWECDQMGHMNVQFYVGKADEGLSALAAALGLSARAQRSTFAALIPREHHIRFHRELRPGAPFAIKAGILASKAEA
jgi:acyl-CoA thioester hydrolase